MDKYREVRLKAPAYCALEDDGAPFKCVECGVYGKARDMWYVAVPDTKATGVYHRGCVDDAWLVGATKIEGSSMKEKYQITRVSPLTRKSNTLEMEFDMEDYRKWQAGTLIQNAMPYLTAGEREFLMTGYTEEDWDTIFPPESDEPSA